MLIGGFAVLSVAVLLGLWLAGTNPADRGGFAHWPIAHGLLGAAGLGVVALAWRRSGFSGPFAADAVGLIGLGLLAGLTIALLRWRRRPVGLAVILTHAALAGIGYLIVAGFAFG
jgi:hypothetical protein